MEVKTKEEWDRVIATLKQKAGEGNVEAMKAVAKLIQMGREYNEDNIRDALPYYKMAADKGDAESAARVGHAYCFAEGIQHNEQLGFKYLKQAADQGLAMAQYTLGIMYHYGDGGVNKNLDLAISYLKLAALQNDSNAQYELFETIMDTRVPEKDDDDDDDDAIVKNMEISLRATHWLACAYANGNEDAIEQAKSLGIENDSFFTEKVNSIKRVGPDPDKQVKSETNNQSPSYTRPPSSQQSGGCYIATAVYGSYDCPPVWTLRRYRDYTLAETWYGRAFIKVYYAISPTLVKWFGQSYWFKTIWKKILDRKVKFLQMSGIDSTKYKDREDF